MNTNNQELELTLTVDEVNVILESLGHLPFMRVYRIIESIQIQAKNQLRLKNGAELLNLQEEITEG